MAGLVPAIHVFKSRKKNADARDKPGHDEVEKIHPLCRFAPLSFVLGLCITNPSRETRDEHSK
jgi:hypothetical protein